MKNATEFLKHLNTAHAKLHSTYEKLFWISNMGDHSVDRQMNEAQKAYDAWRADSKLKTQTDTFLRTSKGKMRDRLKLWSHFFDLYQTPPEALELKARIDKLEAEIHAIRGKRTEGYSNPKTGAFVEASEIRMRVEMRTNPDEAIRKACFDALEKLPLGTLDLYVELIKLRNQYANALGFADFYEYKACIDEDMSKKELFSIFGDIYEKTKFALKDIRALEKKRPGLRKPWNFAYMLSGDFTKEEDQYFQFENVLSYWGRSFAAMGLNFQGGTVTLDLLDRKGKHNNGFCHYPELVRYEGKKRYPGSTNFTSNAVPGQMGAGVQGVHTVFHEGGHAMDRLNSMQPDTCINSEYPPSTVSWAETHSMFMDDLPDSIEWRMRYTKNEKGESYPFDLYERKLKALHMLRPLDLMSICFLVFFEKEIYECKNLNREFVIKTAHRMYNKYFDRSEDSIWALEVSHIYSFQSSGYYHGYGLAQLAVDQWREYFFKKYGYIVDNAKVGKEMTKIWSYASMYPAKKLLKMATGKPLSADAFIRRATKPVEQVLRDAKARIARLEKAPEFKKPVDLGGMISIVHGKKKICDNGKSFEDMEKKFRAWVRTMKQK